jgi:pimeloyl-ACP methyl ester carboxylesterase
MIPIQCGAAEHPILALYDPPGSGSGGSAVLLCHPWASEYIPVYGIMRFLARRLSQAGHHVMRFDYYGCGDSGGEFIDADVDCWTRDAAIAVDELLALSGMRTVTVLGARGGAMIASRLAAERSEIDRVVLWDPIVDPEAYLTELAQKSQGSGNDIPEGWPLENNDATVELHGYPFTGALVRSALCNPIDVAAWRSVRSCLVVSSVSSPDEYARRFKLAKEGTLDLSILSCPWPTDSDGGNVFTPGVVPLEAVEAITAGLK